jgi:hypothetical protein
MDAGEIGERDYWIWTFEFCLYRISPNASRVIIKYCSSEYTDDAPWDARNSDIHRDLGAETVASIIARHALSHENRLQHQVNEEASRLLNVQHLIWRLKRAKPFELVKQFDNWGIQWENLAQHRVTILVFN